MRDRLERWPLLGASALLLGLGLGVEWAGAAAAAGAALLILGAVTLGAFTYAEGARMREWHDERDTPAPRASGPDRAPRGTVPADNPHDHR